MRLMFATLLQQAASGTFSAGIIIALVLVVVASSLALGVTVGLTRRIKSIGDEGQASGQNRMPDDEEDD